MSNVNLSLDDIIAKNRANKKGRGTDSSFKSDTLRNGGGARRGNLRGPSTGSFSKAVPAGKWRHDKFADEPRGAVLSVPANKKVRINLSNLAPTVQTVDLEELFEKYSPEVAVVHYNEEGQSLGTGDVVLKRRDAEKLIQDFKGVAIDGQLISLGLVDQSLGGSSVFDRVQRTGGGGPIRRVQGGFIQKRNGGPAGGPRRGGGSFHNPLDRIDDEEGGVARGGARGGRGGRQGGGGKKKVLTEEELDAELDAYMKK